MFYSMIHDPGRISTGLSRSIQGVADGITGLWPAASTTLQDVAGISVPYYKVFALDTTADPILIESVVLLHLCMVPDDAYNTVPSLQGPAVLYSRDPLIPDADVIQRAYEQAYGVPPTAAVLRFCKKELFQQIWLLLLDDDFVHAYVHGFVVKCADGITRRLFPRILTYSADYPEK
ncbi:hypothetical protein PYCCODRAFT_399980 [Trametes coccinea BRFM310]|uniref:Uncharacterized protein n=1 Tax=Trametes coccinea (strain BRFM310) TaxID=1353009 RepID=A0A1Y2IMQ3_TRAC3|nr:hypothetical protein PYCCODRAFT_399980 [Trametes coccinea BRFM310]